MTTTDTASAPAPQRAAFHAMTEGTQQDWMIIGASALNHMVGLPDRVLAHLRVLDGDFGGFAIDRLQHSLQTAARAERAGRSDEYVFAALLHDIGDTLGSFNHADIGAAIAKPFIGADLHWMMEKHAAFQGYYFFHFLGLDRNARDAYVGHEYYDLTAEFTADFDQPAFDPAYPTPPLEHFEPLVRELMKSPKQSLYQPMDS